MTIVSTLRLVSSELLLGRQPSVDVYELAKQAAREGLTSASLQRLLDAPSRAPADVLSMVMSAIDELGGRPPDKRDAVMFLSKQAAQDIIDGRVTPLTGAETIWRLTIEIDEQIPELATFVFAALEAEEQTPVTLEKYEHAIRKAAQELTASMD
jgi:hypothetical protein